MSTIAIVTGCRHARIDEWMPTIHRALLQHEVDWVIHGAAAGIDSIAEQAAGRLSIPTSVFPADWKQYGKSAGPIRNEEMLRFLRRRMDDGHTGLVLAFHPNIDASKGTRHMTGIAKRAGIPVHLYAHPL